MDVFPYGMLLEIFWIMMLKTSWYMLISFATLHAFSGLSNGLLNGLFNIVYGQKLEMQLGY